MNIRRFASPIGSFSLFNRLICFTMAIIKNGLSMMMRGKVGAFSYYVSETRQIVRQAQNNSNFGATATRSPGQQSRRVVWANLVNFYSGNKGWMKKAFEDLKPGVSVFNRFMQLNLPNAHVALTKAQAASKMWVASPYVVSQGSLNSPLLGAWSQNGESDIKLAEAPTQNDTIAQISAAILESNTGYLNGDAIVAVAFYGFANAVEEYDGTPVLPRYNYYEIVINTSDTRKFSEVYPEWAFTPGNVLINQNLGEAQGFAYIHTRKQSGKLLVSTSEIKMNPDVLEASESWGQSTQVSDATESYKVETPVMLLPGGATTGNSGTDGGGSNPGGGGGDDDENLGE